MNLQPTGHFGMYPKWYNEANRFCGRLSRLTEREGWLPTPIGTSPLLISFLKYTCLLPLFARLNKCLRGCFRFFGFASIRGSFFDLLLFNPGYFRLDRLHQFLHVAVSFLKSVYLTHMLRKRATKTTSTRSVFPTSLAEVTFMYEGMLKVTYWQAQTSRTIVLFI